VRTGTLRGFLQLYMVAGLRPFRRRLLRHQREVAHRDAWLATARDIAARDYALAVKLIELRRLVKGYSDTHARGGDQFVDLGHLNCQVCCDLFRTGVSRGDEKLGDTRGLTELPGEGVFAATTADNEYAHWTSSIPTRSSRAAYS
jgi:hypothetical protein